MTEQPSSGKAGEVPVDRHAFTRSGRLSSGGFGYTPGRPIGYGCVRNQDGVDDACLRSGTHELEVATDRIPCDISLEPFYDPPGTGVRG